MNVYVRVIILRMLNLMNRIKLPLAAVLFTCVVLLSSAAAFASEGESPSSSEVSNWLAPDLDDVQAKAITEEIYDKLSEGTRADATITDVYNILRYDILPGLKGSVSNSNYSLPRIAYDTRRGLFGSGTMDGISAWDLLYWLAPVNNLGSNQFPLVYSPAGSGLTYTLAELSGMSWRHLGDIVSNTASSLTYLSQINSSIQSLKSFNWLSSGASFLGISQGINDNYLTSDLQTSGNLTAVINFTSAFNSQYPCLLRLFVPFNEINSHNGESVLILRSVYQGSNPQISYFDYFVEPVFGGSYIYIFEFKKSTSSNYYLEFSCPRDLYFNAGISGSVSYIPFDSDVYQQMKQAFYQAKAANAQVSMADDVNRLADYLADPDKIAAEQASQGVIDDTLDGFTGNGSAAAKTSDTGAMKNMSGSLQSGLESGASASNATSVFSNQTFWSWFTQSTSNGINSPYPAPVVQQTRGSGDDIPDFLSGNQAELNDLLNQRNSW